jgi:HPt (histidine-containing phosphotransfer) domain-containing protein
VFFYFTAFPAKKLVLPSFWRRNKNVILSDSEESANQRKSVAYFSGYLPIEADSSDLRSPPSPPGLEKFRSYVKSAKKTEEPKKWNKQSYLIRESGIKGYISALFIFKIMHVKEKLYDLTFLKTIAGDDEEGLKDIVSKFLNNTPSEINQLEEAICDENRTLTAGMAHKLKANVKFFHIQHVFEILRGMENTCNDDQANVSFPLYQQQMNNIRRIYTEVFEDLREEIAL